MSDRPKRTSQLAGIIKFAAFIVIIAMAILIGFTTLGAVVSAFDQFQSTLPAPALAVFNFLKVVSSNTFALLSTLLLIAAVGALIAAAFSMGSGGSEQ